MGRRLKKTLNANNVIFPIIFGTMAFALSNGSIWWCEFVLRTSLQYDDRYAFLGNASTGISMWSYQSGGEEACVSYPGNLYLDTRFISARVFTIWTVVAGGITMIILWLSAFCGLGKRAWTVLGFFLFLNCLTSGLVFLILTSAICDPEFSTCSMATGSRCGIAATVFWFLVALSVNVGPEPVRLIREKARAMSMSKADREKAKAAMRDAAATETNTAADDVETAPA